MNRCVRDGGLGVMIFFKEYKKNNKINTKINTKNKFDQQLYLYSINFIVQSDMGEVREILLYTNIIMYYF